MYSNRFDKNEKNVEDEDVIKKVFETEEGFAVKWFENPALMSALSYDNLAVWKPTFGPMARSMPPPANAALPSIKKAAISKNVFFILICFSE